jgi:hypothetical protein
MISRLRRVKNLAFLLVALFLIIGCESNQSPTPAPDKDLIPIHPPLTGVTFSGGDGSSVEKAVIIKAPNNFVGVRAEYDWIKKNHPDWKLKEQSLINVRGKPYDKMDFETPLGPKTIYFDITDFLGKM